MEQKYLDNKETRLDAVIRDFGHGVLVHFSQKKGEFYIKTPNRNFSTAEEVAQYIAALEKAATLASSMNELQKTA